MDIKEHDVYDTLDFFVNIKVALLKHSKWLRNEEGGERANFSGLDLTNIDFKDTELQKADLSEAKLSGVNLANVDLSLADLQNADLSHANLNGAYLVEADLKNADFRCANLSHADLRKTDLQNADFSNANLCFADLSEADLYEASLWNANLSNSDLTDTDLTDIELSYTNLCMTNLYNAKLCDNYNNEIQIKKHIHIDSIGSRNDRAIIFITKDDKILIQCGCFFDYIEKFEEEVHKTHKGNQYEKQYMAMIEMIKTMHEKEQDD